MRGGTSHRWGTPEQSKNTTGVRGSQLRLGYPPARMYPHARSWQGVCVPDVGYLRQGYHPSWPVSAWWGTARRVASTPYVVLDWGVPQLRSWPWEVSWPAVVPPSQVWWGGTPLAGVPPSRPGLGTPPSGPGQGSPPPRLRTDRWTDTFQNRVTFPSYYGTRSG